jgi:hypothetical protein
MKFKRARKLVALKLRRDESAPGLRSPEGSNTLVLALGCSILVLSSLSSVLKAQAQSGEYYVATNGNDSNPGTMSQPWKHIGYAASNNAVQPGDTVYIRGGTYDESIIQQISGSPGQPITYRNFPGEVPIIGDADAPGEWRWFILDQSHLTIQGITFSDYHGGAIHVRTIDTDMTDITIVDCTFEHQKRYSEANAQHAVYFTSYRSGHYLQNISVQGNHFHDIDTLNAQGIGNEVLTVAGDVRDVKFVGNAIANVTSIGIDIIGRSTIGQPTRVLVSGNNVSAHGLAHPSASGIYLDGAGTDVIVEGNVVHSGPLGITVNLELDADDLETQRVIVRRNVLYNNGINLKLGVGSWQDDCAQRTAIIDSVAVHNTVFSDIDGQVNNYFGCGEGLRWKNNIYSHTSPGGGYQYQFVNETADPYTWTLDYNFFHSNGEAKSYQWEGETYESLSSLQAASGEDQNSREGNPLFRDAINRNFHLEADSPARNTGGPLTTTNSSGSGTTIPVDDARYFSNGLGLQAGDRIRVGNNDPVMVIGVDHVNNRITMDESISWQDEEPVNYDYSESGPDSGAYEEHSVDYIVYLPWIATDHPPQSGFDAPPTGDRRAFLVSPLTLLQRLGTFIQLKLSFWLLAVVVVVVILLAWQLRPANTRLWSRSWRRWKCRLTRCGNVLDRNRGLRK